MDLLPKRDPGIGAEHHERGARLAILPCLDVVDRVAAGRGRGVEETLQVHLAPVLQGELPVVVEPNITKQSTEALGHPGQHHEVILGVEERRDALSPPDLQERVRARGRDL